MGLSIERIVSLYTFRTSPETRFNEHNAKLWRSSTAVFACYSTIRWRLEWGMIDQTNDNIAILDIRAGKLFDFEGERRFGQIILIQGCLYHVSSAFHWDSVKN